MPLMDTATGSAGLERGLKPADQSLDSLANPNGAPGQAVDLSMEGTYRKKKAEDQMTSSLYQPLPETAAPGAPLAAGAAPASASFAAALKEISKKTDASGWGGAAPQKGFTPPKGNFSGLSGFGGGGGGGSGAALSLGAFGTAVAKTGVTTTRGLGPLDSGQGAKGGAPAMSSLKAAQAQGLAAAMQRSGDASAALARASFDGSRGGSAISGGQGESLGGSYANLDAVPMNLKPNNPELNKFNYQPVPAVVAAMDTSAEQKRALVMAVAGALIGGLIGGPAGNAISMAVMMAAVTQGRSVNSGSNVAGQTQTFQSAYR